MDSVPAYIQRFLDWEDAAQSDGGQFLPFNATKKPQLIHTHISWVVRPGLLQRAPCNF